ncbi:hypothetical protein C8C84_2835 [Flavobacterium sp. 102]|nr:hypothetical protein C8C84_2835 [Flavobacterium sp. 102]
MNYLSHFLNKSLSDNLNPSHISLYLAIYHCWQHNNQINPVSITSKEIMQRSKINSRATYHKCLKDLHNKKYLNYTPSFNPFKSSQVFLLLPKRIAK